MENKVKQRPINSLDDVLCGPQYSGRGSTAAAYAFVIAFTIAVGILATSNNDVDAKPGGPDPCADSVFDTVAFPAP
jgi:hypothetical protein